MRFITSLIVASVLLSGCARRGPMPSSVQATATSPTPAIAQRLIGKWAMAGWEHSLTFAADGAVMRNVEGQDTPGTFKLSADGKRLLFAYSDGTKLDTSFTLNSESLVLAMDDAQAGIKEPITLLRSQ